MNFPNPHSLLESYYSIYDDNENFSEGYKDLPVEKMARKSFTLGMRTASGMQARNSKKQKIKGAISKVLGKKSKSNARLDADIDKNVVRAQNIGTVLRTHSPEESRRKNRINKRLGASSTKSSNAKNNISNFRREDYFDYLVNYIMEEGYEYIDALEIIEEMDDETIEIILNEA